MPLRARQGSLIIGLTLAMVIGCGGPVSDAPLSGDSPWGEGSPDFTTETVVAGETVEAPNDGGDPPQGVIQPDTYVPDGSVGPGGSADSEPAPSTPGADGDSDDDESEPPALPSDPDPPATDDASDPEPPDPPDSGDDDSQPSRLFACDQHVVAQSGLTVTVTLSGYDPDGVAVAFSIASRPSHGDVTSPNPQSVNLATVTYTASADYVGPDEFTYTVTVDGEHSRTALVTVDVVPRPTDIPECCPDVYLDSNGNFVIDGDRKYLVGFWSMYQSDPGWNGFASAFNALTNGSSSDFVNEEMQARDLYLQAQSALSIDPNAPDTEAIDASRVADATEERNIISWELYHEPNYYPLDHPLGNVPAQTAAIRSSDACKRLVMVTPSAGAGSLFTEYAKYVDYFALQYYPSPIVPLRTVADHLDGVQRLIGDAPIVYVYRVQGYQPQRYRVWSREPTPAEVRAAAYLGATHGAKGFFMYSHSKGVGDRDAYGFEELYDARYNILDSPQFYAAVQDIGRNLHANAPILTASPADSAPAASHADIHCRMWDVNGELPGGGYLVAVNVCEESSPYFEVISNGNRVERIRAYALTTDGTTLPCDQCSDGRDNDGDGLTDLADSDCHGPSDESESDLYPLWSMELAPDEMYLKPLNAGISNQDHWVEQVRLHFLSAPPGANVRFAIYTDARRDRAPDDRVYLSDWIDIPDNGGWLNVDLDSPVRLAHTQYHYLAVSVSHEGVWVNYQDVRNGVRQIPGHADFLERYPDVNTPQPLTVNIDLGNTQYKHYRVMKTMNANSLDMGTVQDGVISDTFEPLAVHVYQLIPE